MTRIEKLLEHSVELVEKLSELTECEFDQAVNDINNQYHNLQGKEYEFCNEFYSKIFDAARKRRNKKSPEITGK